MVLLPTNIRYKEMLQDIMLRFNLSEAGLVGGDQKNYTRF